MWFGLHAGLKFAKWLGLGLMWAGKGELGLGLEIWPVQCTDAASEVNDTHSEAGIINSLALPFLQLIAELQCDVSPWLLPF